MPNKLSLYLSLLNILRETNAHLEQQIVNLSSRIDLLQTQLAVSNSSQPNVTISNQCNENSQNSQPPRSFYNGRNKFLNKNSSNSYKHPNSKPDSTQTSKNWRKPNNSQKFPDNSTNNRDANNSTNLQNNIEPVREVNNDDTTSVNNSTEEKTTTSDSPQ